jgi:hypothetical protein
LGRLGVIRVLDNKIFGGRVISPLPVTTIGELFAALKERSIGAEVIDERIRYRE